MLLILKKLFSKFPLVSRTVLFIILPLVIFISVEFYSLNKRLAIKESIIDVRGKDGNISIIRDDFGVPTIAAVKDNDAYYALGMVHAQDRLWQMEVARRKAAGRLSEILGEGSLSSDILMKTLGLYRHSEKAWQQLGSFEKEVLIAYTKGVNDSISQLKSLPLEFLRFSVEPEPWRPQDSLILMQHLSWQWSGNMNEELLNATLQQVVGQKKTNQLLQSMDINDPVFSFIHLNNLRSDEMVGTTLFSNVYGSAIVVSGQHSKHAMPVLVSDIKLGTTTQSRWYLANVQGDKLNAAGATIPGLPIFFSGKNNDITWSITTAKGDTQDLYIEQINPLNRNQYMLDGQYKTMELVTEQINFKHDILAYNKPYEFTVRRTAYGPVISDIKAQLSDLVYSLQWTGDDELGGSFSSFVKLNYASNWDEFNQALINYVAPIIHIAYADKLGNIGAVSPGYYPVRNKAISVPSKGWQKINHWRHDSNDSGMSSVFNPNSGYIIMTDGFVLVDKQANLPSQINYGLASELEELTNQVKLTRNELAKLILNPKSQLTNQGLAYINQVLAYSSLWPTVTKLLREWQGDLQVDSAAAVVFHLWLYEFYHMAITDDLATISTIPGAAILYDQLMARPKPAFIEQLFQGGGGISQWCDLIDSDNVETCDDIALIAMQVTLEKLHSELGYNYSDWRWSEVFSLEFNHFPFAQRKSVKDSILRSVFSRKILPSCQSVILSDWHDSGISKRIFYGFIESSYLQFIDLADSANDSLLLGTGQSGNPLRRHYDDLIELNCTIRNSQHLSGT